MTKRSTQSCIVAGLVAAGALVTIMQSEAAPPSGKGKPKSQCILVAIPASDDNGNATDAYLDGALLTDDSTTGTGTLTFRSNQSSVTLDSNGEVAAVSIDANFTGDGNGDIGDALHWMNEYLDCDGDGSVHDLFPLSAINLDGSVTLVGTLRVTVTSEPGNTQCNMTDPTEFTQPTNALLRLDFYGNTAEGNPIPFEVMVGGFGALLKNFCVLPNRSAFPTGTNGDPAAVLLGVDSTTCCNATCCTTNNIPGVTFRIRQAGKKRKKGDECSWTYGTQNTRAYVYIESLETSCP